MKEYARQEHHDFAKAVDQALVDEPLQKALARLTGTLLAGNRRGYAALPDSGELRDRAKQIKQHTLAHLDKYLEQLAESVVRQPVTLLLLQDPFGPGSKLKAGTEEKLQLTFSNHVDALGANSFSLFSFFTALIKTGKCYNNANLT